MDDLVIKAPLAWVRPGETIGPAAVAASSGELTYVGPAAAAPQGREHVRVNGVLMPAVADRHVHIGMADPASVLLGGVTAVRDLGWPADRIFPLAEASEIVTFNGPLIRAVGPFLTAPGGYPTRDPDPPPGCAIEIREPAEIEPLVRNLAERGAVAIKVALNADEPPTLDDAALAEICRAAAGCGLPVTAHAQGAGQVERALGAGVAELAHAPFTESLPDHVVQSIAGSLRIVSTLDLVRIHHGNDALRTALDNLRRFQEAGGTIVYGTDLGLPEWGLPPGINLREVLLLRECGLDPERVLQALVRSPLEVGAPADLLTVGRNPAEDPEALADIGLVVRAGRVIVAR